MLTAYSIRRTSNTKKSSLGKEQVEQVRSPPQIQEEAFAKLIDYEKVNMNLFRIHSSGIQIVVINDYNNVFYLVLSINIPTFNLSIKNELEKSVGETLVKAMASYYNAQAGEWDPLIDKTRIHLLVDSHLKQNFILLSF